MEFKISASDFVYEHSGKLRDAYKIGKKLGEGAFSTVRSMRHRVTGENRAVKIIHKKSLRTASERAMFFNEVAIMRELDHPNIVQLFEFYQDDKNYYMISEYCNGGELFERIVHDGNMCEAVAADYMRQILSVLLYLHERNIVHRDLKPENFLLSRSESGTQIKAIDFGSACHFVKGQILTEKTGTAYYIAPEVLNRHYDETCDIWSAGVILYILLCAFPPFHGNTDNEILDKVLAGQLSFPPPEWDYVSGEAKDLISKMLNSEKDARLNARECLDHPWMTSAGRTPLNPAIASKYLRNMKNFHSQQLLEKATLAFIGAQLATHDEREEMIQLFRSLDTDDNGTLSRNEIREGLDQIFSGEFDDIDAEVDRIMREVDIDNSGAIDYSEFVTATINRQQLLSQERLRIAFDTFDIDGSGSISADELKNFLGRYQRHEEGFWQQLIKEVDENGDGEIDFSEFVHMMTNTIK